MAGALPGHEPPDGLVAAVRPFGRMAHAGSKYLLLFPVVSALLSGCALVDNGQSCCEGGEYYEWIAGEKVALNPVPSEWIIRIPLQHADALDAIRSKPFVPYSVVAADKTNDDYWVHVKNLSPQHSALLASRNKALHIAPLFRLERDGFKHPTRIVHIEEWAEDLSEVDIDQLVGTYRLERDTSTYTVSLPDDDFYVVTPPFEKTSLEIANELVELGYARDAHSEMMYWIEAYKGGAGGAPGDDH